jgi:hypothetical protein
MIQLWGGVVHSLENLSYSMFFMKNGVDLFSTGSQRLYLLYNEYINECPL